MDIFSTDQKYIASTYKRFPVAISHGKGSEVWDFDGKRYIDMGSGIGVTAFGIADEIWQQAVTEQIGKVQHMSNLYYTEPCVKLAKLLCEKSGMKKVFFGNSGAEANEGAIKAARKYAAEKKGSDYYTIITLENSFHGRTLTTLAATGQEHFHQLFQPLTPGFIHVPANDLDAMKKAVGEHKIAGIMMEVIQGEGGVKALDEAYVKAVAELCSSEDIVLIIDEVQSGNGRSGAMYAYQNYGILPDVVSTAKGLAGGLPIGAVLLGEKVQNIFSYGDHGSTFGGNPVSCAAAVSIVERIDDALLAEVREKSAYLFETLGKAEGIREVSGMGLMIGLTTEKPAGEVLAECMKRGVLCLTAKDKLRLLPAINIPMPVLKEAAEIIAEACR
ncbi:MAG: aspartate aminotransferase family protein [Lachnospiraceae bacterium]|nr:aspartate aminotransferase family protein [Lachnospiraceae bacterium]